MSDDENQWSQFTDVVESMRLRNNVDRNDIAIIKTVLSQLESQEDWERIIQMRESLSRFIVSETFGNHEVLQQLSRSAINACDKLNKPDKCGQYLHDYGQYLHRASRHEEAIHAFERSKDFFTSAGESYRFQAVESHYMTALCNRALGRYEVARSTVLKVIDSLQPEDPWIAHPLQVLAWLQQDAGEIQVAEQTLDRVISLHEANEGSNAYILIQVYADIAEIRGILGNHRGAETGFKQSLAIADQYTPDSNRQIVRTSVKYAQFCAGIGRYHEAEMLLNRAGRLLSLGVNVDYLWRIEFVRAYVYFKQFKLLAALRSLRIGIKVRRFLKLPNQKYLTEYVWRAIQQIGPPR